ncbi:MAG: glycosyltransferase family 4 protein [Bacillota bacterium]
MNVWIVNHYTLPPDRPGGTRHYTLAKELIRRGYHVTIWASSFDYLSREEKHLTTGELWKREIVDGVPFVWVRTPGYRGNSPARVWNMLAFAYRFWRLGGRNRAEKPDVIVGSSPHPFAALAAERLAARFGVPFILEVRDLWPQTLIDLGNFSPQHPFIILLAKIERFLYRKSAAIITLLPAAKEYMTGKGADSSRIVWIPNGIDLELVPSPQLPKSEGSFTVMYAGAHGLANGLELVLKAAYLLEQEQLQDRIRFRFIGDGTEKPNLIAMAKRLGLRSVCFEDPVPKKAIYSLLQEADAFLLIHKDLPLYRWGASPNKLFDFLAMARPIIYCANVPFNPVKEADAGVIVPPGNPKALADAIKRLALLSPEERWSMGMRGRAYVEKYHSLNRLADKLEEVLKHVAEVR